MKNSVSSHEVKTNDFINGPVLLDAHICIGFQDIGYNIRTVNRLNGEESFQTREGVALIEEYHGRISFLELQVVVV